MGRQVFTIEPLPGREICGNPIIRLGLEVCDFCNSSPVVKIYACHNFLVPGTKHAVFAQGSLGAWASCSHCSYLVDKRKWSRLTDRSTKMFMRKHGTPSYEYSDLREQFRLIHYEFKKHLIREV